MVEVSNKQKNYDFSEGCISFDTNVDHLAYTELEGHGNLLSHHTIPFTLRGLSTGQREQVLSKALEEIFQYARNAAKPGCHELPDARQLHFFHSQMPKLPLLPTPARMGR